MSLLQRNLVLGLLLVVVATGCDAWERKFFVRESPEVNKAIKAIETRDAGAAARVLTEYLNTGKCKDGALGIPELVRDRPYASVDLGLTLFQLAERFGDPFGELPTYEPDEAQSALLASRSGQVDCALRVVRTIAADTEVPLALRAQAFYLSGNLEFLRHDYRSAVTSYDSVIELFPGGVDAGGDVGTRAAFNRAIALKRIQDEPEPPEPPDGGAPGDGGAGQEGDDQQKEDESKPEQDEQKDESEPDKSENEPEQNDESEQEDESNKDSSDQDQNKQEPQEGNEQSESQPQPSQSAEPQAPPPSLGQDERVLDLLERAPMLQHAPNTNGQRSQVRRGMADK